MKVLCVKCQINLKLERAGVNVVETFGLGSDQPYKLWRADFYKCPNCGVEIITSFAGTNYAEHFQKDFAKKLEEAEPKYWDKTP